MKANKVRVVGGPLVLTMSAEVDELEKRLWITLPEGYRRYVTKLGEGILGGSFVRIYPPWRIEKELSDWRRRINKHWFWDEGPELLPKERAVECVIIGDTVNGDELVFHPARPNALFVLPRDSEQAFEAGENVLAAVEWMCSSGKLIEPFPERDFKPLDSRKELTAASARSAKVEDSDGESLEDIVDLGKQWATRHKARAAALKDLDEHVGNGRVATLLFEAFLLEGEYPFQPGYLAVFRITDTASRLEVGRFSWHRTGGSSGSQYEPNQTNLAKLGKTE